MSNFFTVIMKALNQLITSPMYYWPWLLAVVSLIIIKIREFKRRKWSKSKIEVTWDMWWIIAEGYSKKHWLKIDGHEKQGHCFRTVQATVISYLARIFISVKENFSKLCHVFFIDIQAEYLFFEIGKKNNLLVNVLWGMSKSMRSRQIFLQNFHVHVSLLLTLNEFIATNFLTHSCLFHLIFFELFSFLVLI